MNRREAERLNRQRDVLVSLGFTAEEAESLRRISRTLHRWHELECGNEHGCIERDEKTGRPMWGYHDSRNNRHAHPIRDRETGAKKRLAAILKAHGARLHVCPNCQQWQRPENGGDCLNECARRGFAPPRKLSAFIQTDPRGAALYILRPGDVPEGARADAYYSRGICVY